MLAGSAPGSKYATVERFREAGIVSGYTFRVSDCRTNGQETRMVVSNQGIAPIYRDAYMAIGNTESKISLKGLLPGKGVEIVIPVGLSDADDLKIVSPYILSGQKIEFETGSFTGEMVTPTDIENVYDTHCGVVKQLRNGRVVIVRNNTIYNMMGQKEY
jgi:hypothetical protein